MSEQQTNNDEMNDHSNDWTTPIINYPSDVVKELFPTCEGVKDESDLCIVGTDVKKISA